MIFGKLPLLLVIAACVSTNAGVMKQKTQKTVRTKVKIPDISPKCGCQLDIFGSPIDAIMGPLQIGVPGYLGPVSGPIASIPAVYPGCRVPIIEPFGPMEIAYSGYLNPVIDVPNYRYADLLELNSLGSLFPVTEIPNYGIISALPSVECFKAVELPCGCPGPQCGCRAPAVKLPASPEYFAPVEISSCGCQSLQSHPTYSYGASLIELPSYVEIPACRCQGPCSCSEFATVNSQCNCKGPYPEYQILSCGCQGRCSCPDTPLISCTCKGPCSCPEYQLTSCGCQGPCTCSNVPAASCNCQGSCSCTEYQLISCGCQGPCTCSNVQTSCNCQDPCKCSGIPLPCGCQGSCSCPIQATVGLLPTIEVPSCGCGISGCDSCKYLRQVTLQPPFL